MNQTEIETNEELELNNENTVESQKEKFEEILSKIKKMSEAIEFHNDVKEAVSKEEVDNNYLSYIENSLENKFFCDAKFNRIKSKILLEIVCPELAKLENFDVKKLDIQDIGSHLEGIENYIDKICIYDNQFVCLFGINERKAEDVIKYEARKFSRVDMIEAMCMFLEEGKTAQMEQYDEYYVVSTENGLKVFSEKKITSLVKVEETVFDKIKTGLTSLFNKKLFAKKKCLPNIELIFDTNIDRLTNFEHSSKIDAKNRIKNLLYKEREVTRNTTM